MIWREELEGPFDLYLKPETLLGPVPLVHLVAAFASGAIRVAPGGLAEDPDQDRDGDDRDDHQEDQGYDGEAHGLPLLARTKAAGFLPTASC